MAAAVLARTPDDVRDAVAAAVAANEPLEVVGRGGKRAVGRVMSAPRTLDVSGLSGVVDYAPDELVLVARPGAPLSEIETLLRENRQTFAFEPPTFGRLLGTNAGASLGGMIASNLSGPRRFQAGAVRDHFLGFHAVSGRGVPFVAGSRVMKNVTGYDLSKLMAGSWGTLAVLTQVNLRTAPLPEAEDTTLVRGLDEEQAVARMSAALKSPAAITGAAHLPAAVAGALAAVPSGGASLTALRVEGTPASVTARREMLQAAGGELAVISGEASRALWREIANAEPLAEPADQAVWRLTVEPALSATIARSLRERHGGRALIDWAGGLITVALPQALALAAPVWDAIPKGRGHAMLLRGSTALRQTPFSPMDPGLAALNGRVKRAYDPAGVLNPGRMYEGL